MNDRRNWQQDIWGDPVNQQVEDYIYRAWIAESQHTQGPVPFSCKIITAGDAEDWNIPYMQNIFTRHDPQSGQVGLLCPSAGINVFIDGTGLDLLGDLVAQKKVHSIHQFDPTRYHPPGENEPVITGVKVEQS